MMSENEVQIQCEVYNVYAVCTEQKFERVEIRFKRSINRGLQHYVDAGGLSVHVMSAQI